MYPHSSVFSFIYLFFLGFYARLKILRSVVLVDFICLPLTSTPFAAENLGLTAVELTAVGLKAARVVLAEALLKSRHTVCKSAHRALPGLARKTFLRTSTKNPYERFLIR